jgi:hypothetical protein
MAFQTNPMTTPRARALPAAGAVQSGIATKYWLELKAYPPGSARSLWLFVDDTWRHLDDPDPGMQASVQAAFTDNPDQLDTVAWYSDDLIVGLVVRSKL